MDSTWQIRKATTHDAEGLRRCMESAYAAYQDRMQGQHLPPMDADYRAEIEKYPTWVADLDGAIAGGLIMSFDKHRATLANIAVDPRYQGRGIGGALMRFAELKTRERAYSELNLATHVLLHENIALYQHLGWRETGRKGSKIMMKKGL